MHAQLCLTLCNPMDYTHQASLSMDFFHQEYWSGLPFPPPGGLPDPGIELHLLHWQVDFFFLPLSHQRSCLCLGILS